MDSRKAIRVIRDCLRAGRFAVKPHFAQRMDERGLFWADVEAVIDSPSRIGADGHDDFGRDRWLIAGIATDGLDLELLCVLDKDDQGNTIVFITIYWDN